MIDSLIKPQLDASTQAGNKIATLLNSEIDKFDDRVYTAVMKDMNTDSNQYATDLLFALLSRELPDRVRLN